MIQLHTLSNRELLAVHERDVNLAPEPFRTMLMELASRVPHNRPQDPPPFKPPRVYRDENLR